MQGLARHFWSQAADGSSRRILHVVFVACSVLLHLSLVESLCHHSDKTLTTRSLALQKLQKMFCVHTFLLVVSRCWYRVVVLCLSSPEGWCWVSRLAPFLGRFAPPGIAWLEPGPHLPFPPSLALAGLALAGSLWVVLPSSSGRCLRAVGLALAVVGLFLPWVARAGSALPWPALVWGPPLLPVAVCSSATCSR